MGEGGRGGIKMVARMSGIQFEFLGEVNQRISQMSGELRNFQLAKQGSNSAKKILNILNEILIKWIQPNLTQSPGGIKAAMPSVAISINTGRWRWHFIIFVKFNAI